MTIPRSDDRTKKQTGVRIPDALLRRAKAYAAAHGITFEALVEDALTAYLDRAEKRTKK